MKETTDYGTIERARNKAETTPKTKQKKQKADH